MKLEEFFDAGVKPVCVLEYYLSDRDSVLLDVLKFSNNSPVYYWNLGFGKFQKCVCNDEGRLELVSIEGTVECCGEAVLDVPLEGVKVIDGLFDVRGNLSREVASKLTNIFFDGFGKSDGNYLVLMGNYVSLSVDLLSVIEAIDYGLPGLSEVVEIIEKLSDRFGIKEDIDAMVIAARGLSKGDIEINVSSSCNLGIRDGSEVAGRLLDAKMAVLSRLGLEYVGEPDVSSAGGLDLLNAHLDLLEKLNEPEAAEYGLKLPKGMLLWGPPGTGKSLSAKLIAKRLNLVLMPVSWGNIIGAPSPDRCLTEILERADNIGPCMLYFDDFDKGFAGSSTGSGVSARLAQKLLTWMQEHTTPVLMLATINRLGMLPPELVRRFSDGGVWFVDLPNNGERYAIFKLFLGKYFPEGDWDSWSDREWFRVIRDYGSCTGAEIANAVKAVAARNYADGRPGNLKSEDLLYQRTQFVASTERSEEVLAIRNKATFAKPASSRDTSKFAPDDVGLFEFDASTS